MGRTLAQPQISIVVLKVSRPSTARRAITLGAALLLAACAGAPDPERATHALSPGPTCETTPPAEASITQEPPPTPDERTLTAVFEPALPETPAIRRLLEVVQADTREEQQLLLSHPGRRSGEFVRFYPGGDGKPGHWRSAARCIF